MARLPRLFVDGPLAPGDLSLAGDAAKRLLSVLRLSSGDAFRVFSGDGREYEATVAAGTAKRVAVSVGAVARQEPPPALSLELCSGLVRANRFDLVVEKATEAGADVITPLVSERSARGDAPSKARYDRWERLVVEASEQSGRLYLPVLQQPITFERLCERGRRPLLLAHPDGMSWGDATALLPVRGPLVVAIGPEGGFSDEEVEAARLAGALVVSIAPNVLRTETAAIVATALVRAAGLH